MSIDSLIDPHEGNPDSIRAEHALVIALKEAEHRPFVEQRFPEAASRVTYWHVDDIGFAHSSIALAMIDEHVDQLISTLRLPASR